MNPNEKTYTQPIGLDVGTSRIVAARAYDQKQRYEAQLNAFLALPYSKLTESLLKNESICHQVEGGEILVTGDDAQKFAEVFHAETRRPMKSGVVNPHEPYSLVVIRSLITKLLGRAETERQKVFFSVPAPVDESDGGMAYHVASISLILTELGYEATPLEEGLAVVFGELGNSNYSGIGISCGSGLCNVCLATLSVPVISFSVPKAGDFIDAQAALVTGDLATRLRVRKERSFYLNGHSGDREQNALSVYYRDMMTTLSDALTARISSAQRLPKIDQSVPLVLSGGTVMPTGFLDQFTAIMRAHDFPLKLSEIRLSPDPLNSTARGALMAALC